jgi:hypothetical protein
MRPYPILLAGGLWLAACEDGGPPTEGTLVVSTSTDGSSRDPGGYRVAVDSVDFHVLGPADTAHIDLPVGHHTLRLLDVAANCVVAPGTSLDIDITPGGMTRVAFVVSCAQSGARITAVTTGLDFDGDGFRVQVDGADRDLIYPNGAVLTPIDPGPRTITLTGLAPNCAITGPAVLTVTIAPAEVMHVEFTVVCTAVSGVIGVTVKTSGTDVDGDYVALVDGERSFFVGTGGPAYLVGVPDGEHPVSLRAPPNCSVENSPQSVRVTTGGLVRDTVGVTFSVTCVPRLPGTLRITTPTTGPIPTQAYSVWLCKPRYDCWFYPVTWRRLGSVLPNDSLVTSVEAGRYQLQLRDVPANCTVRPKGGGAFGITNGFTIAYGGTVEIEFKVACSR